MFIDIDKVHLLFINKHGMHYILIFNQKHQN